MTNIIFFHTATFIKDMHSLQGTAHLYKMNPFIEGYQYVIVSAIKCKILQSWIHETYILGCDKNGENIDYDNPISGSRKDICNIKQTLSELGYRIIDIIQKDVDNKKSSFIIP